MSVYVLRREEDRVKEVSNLPAMLHVNHRIRVLQELIMHFRERVLGGRVFSCTTGSAPSAPEMLAWQGEVMGYPVRVGYGSTESGVSLLDGKIVAK